MDNRAEVREFLSSRRARLTPDMTGVVSAGGRRRVPGLRRDEVARLAGVSVDYYTKVERGSLGGVSDSVLDSIARALEMDQAERDHLYDLARAATPARRRPAPSLAQKIAESPIQHMLDSMTGAVAMVTNTHMDLVAANALGFALYSDMYRGSLRPANHSRFIFLDPGLTISTRTGSALRTSTSPSSGAMPDAIPTTPGSLPSSENSRSEVTTSAPGGPSTTFGVTTPVRNSSGTPSWASSNSTSMPWTYKTPPVTT